MTDTPRTDVIITKDNFVPGDVIDLCYDLESKLAEATREIERLRSANNDLRSWLEDARRERNAAMQIVDIALKSGEPK